MSLEIQFHIEARAADLVRSGLSPEEAGRQARIEFGAISAVSEECREARGLRWADEMRADLRYAARMLRRNPGFAAVAVFSLALGIGANTAIFTLLDTVLLKSLPLHRPDRLFFVDDSGGKSQGQNAPPYPCYEMLRDRNRQFSGMAAFHGLRFKVTIGSAREQINGQFASGSYFDVLGVPAVLGRVLTSDDDSRIRSGATDGAAAVIGYDFWTRRFERSPAVLGRRIQVDDVWVTIVGVTPPGFLGLQPGSPVDITVPIALNGKRLQERRDGGSAWSADCRMAPPSSPGARAR